MKQELYLLAEDREYIAQRIDELEQEILDMGPEFHDALYQSNETWHDNAPFDAARDKQSVLAAEQQKLRRILREATLIKKTSKKGTVQIGSYVELSDGSRYRVAGDWTHKAGKHADGVTWISCQAPLAVALISKKVGDLVRLGKTVLTITSCT